MGLIVLGTLPVAFRLPPSPTGKFFDEETEFQVLGYLFLAGVVAAVIALTARFDPEKGRAKTLRYIGFTLIAGLLTEIHHYTVDLLRFQWQVDQFNDVLRHTAQAPDQYRFTAQGLLWWMLLVNGDFAFSYLAYRFLFTFLLCQVIYSFARLYLPPRDSVIVVLLYALFYHSSIRYSFGNLIDPLSHAALLAALVCCHQERFWPVFCTFVLGMFVKETTLLIVPCYWILNAGRIPARTLGLRVGGLLLTGVLVFLACRLPFHFGLTFQSLNRTYQLMILSNLGLAGGKAQSPISVFQRYLHPFVFIFSWLTFIVWQRERLPRKLLIVAAYLGLASYGVNLCFGWNYESRNFVPALVVFLVATLYVVRQLTEPKDAPPIKLA